VLPLIDIILSRIHMHLSPTVESVLSSDLMFEKTFAFDLAAKVSHESRAEVAIIRLLVMMMLF
jgi:hypothetical protein